MTCRWNGRGEPRVLPGRHAEGCAAEECPGCLPCPERHCSVCRRVHASGACPECLAATRDDLAAIRLMCGALSTEVEHRGVNGEAMMLLGPSANPEAWRNRAMSAIMGRLPDGYLEDCRDEQHPLYVLAGWEDIYRDELDQPTDLRATVERAGDYLARHLHTFAECEEVPFEDFARDVRGCRGHLEDVLHDGEQRDTGAPCMTCGVPLERVWGEREAEDGWRCPRCRERSTEDQYRFAVAHLHREEATELTDRDMEIRTGVKAGTVRVWAKRGLVRARWDSGRVLYRVEDVLRRTFGEAS